MGNRDNHLTARSGAELRDWGYPKVANAAALPTLTAAEIGTIYTTSDNGVSHELVESDGTTAKWRPLQDFPDANGDVWEYRVDTNGNLHRWYAKQPPVQLSGGTDDIVTVPTYQIPQTDFTAEFLIQSDDYSNGDQGLGGQYVALGGLRGWAARLRAAGTIQVYAGTGASGILRETAKTIYQFGMVDSFKLRVLLNWRHLGATIECDVSVAQVTSNITAHTDQPVWVLVETLSFPLANLHNDVCVVHLGSRFRNTPTGSAAGNILFGNVEAFSLAVGGIETVRFPHPVGLEAWEDFGNALTDPPTFTDPSPNACDVYVSDFNGSRSGSFVDGCAVQAMTTVDQPELDMDPAVLPVGWRQLFSGGLTGTEMWTVMPDIQGTNQWQR